jgi:hypothetical protein
MANPSFEPATHGKPLIVIHNPVIGAVIRFVL